MLSELELTPATTAALVVGWMGIWLAWAVIRFNSLAAISHRWLRSSVQLLLPNEVRYEPVQPHPTIPLPQRPDRRSRRCSPNPLGTPTSVDHS